jgi:hypothetical protein
MFPPLPLVEDQPYEENIDEDPLFPLKVNHLVNTLKKSYFMKILKSMKNTWIKGSL